MVHSVLLVSATQASSPSKLVMSSAAWAYPEKSTAKSKVAANIFIQTLLVLMNGIFFPPVFIFVRNA